ncbi:hypothetical protein HA44_22000 [Mixta gaviniae]|nr:hypothetical protein HA44_22000 [Mixta gaviniae]
MLLQRAGLARQLRNLLISGASPCSARVLAEGGAAQPLSNAALSNGSRKSPFLIFFLLLMR